MLNYPDYVLFDLDPYIYSGKEGKGAEPELNTVAFEKGKEVAFWLRDLLQSMALEAIVKTSGKTGCTCSSPFAARSTSMPPGTCLSSWDNTCGACTPKTSRWSGVFRNALVRFSWTTT